MFFSFFKMSSSLMRNLNCIAGPQNYGSIDTLASETIDTDHLSVKRKSKKRLNLFKKIRKLRKQLISIKESENEDEEEEEEYAIAYESCPEDQNLNEQTRLIKKKTRRVRRHSIATIDNYNQDVAVTKPARRNVTTIEELLSYKSTMPNDGNKKNKKNKNKKKKSGFLKRTGKFIVRTCRLMTYSTPYGIAHLPPDVYDPDNGKPSRDYRFYDFEKGEYDYNYTNGYMGYTSTYTPTVFF